MEIFKNDLDYKILDLFRKGYMKINETEYFLEKKTKNLIFFEEDRKYSISKNLRIYCYHNNKRIKTDRKINEFEEELMKLILDGYVKINNVEFTGNQISTIFKLRSTSFTIDKEGNKGLSLVL